MYKSVAKLINTDNSISVRTQILKEITTNVYYKIYNSIFISQGMDLSGIKIKLRLGVYEHGR